MIVKGERPLSHDIEVGSLASYSVLEAANEAVSIWNKFANESSFIFPEKNDTRSSAIILIDL